MCKQEIGKLQAIENLVTVFNDFKVEVQNLPNFKPKCTSRLFLSQTSSTFFK